MTAFSVFARTARDPDRSPARVGARTARDPDRSLARPVGARIARDPRRAARAHFRRKERGVSLVSAIFLVVVLAALGAVAVKVGVMQQQTAALGLRSAEALHAARAGVAWAAYRAINAGWCATDTLSLTETGAAGFSVTVSCSASTHPEGSGTVHVYVIDALAEAGTYGSADYVSRRLQAKIAEET